MLGSKSATAIEEMVGVSLVKFHPNNTVLLKRIRLNISRTIGYHPTFFTIGFFLSNDPGMVDSNFFCYAATVLSPQMNILIFTQRMHKPT